MNPSRIQWIDNEKGFILLGVCIAHIGFSWNIFPYLVSFHMAAFFFLSGLLFRPDRDWSEFFHTKCKNLLFPYLILSLFFLFLTPSLYQLSTHYPGSLWQNHIAAILTDNPYLHSLFVQIQIYLLDIINGYSAPYVTPLWFVFTLFILNILWFFPIRWLSRYKFGKYVLGILAIILFVLGWLLYMHGINPIFKTAVLVTSSAFFIGGFILKDFIPYLSRIKQYWLLLLTLVMAAIYTYGTKNASVTAIGYVLNELHPNLLAYTAVSWGGTFLLTLLFIIIDRINKPLFIGHILRLIAQNGIAILALHAYILGCMTWASHTFALPLLANKWLIALTIIIFCIIALPFINKYLYVCVGKKKPQAV